MNQEQYKVLYKNLIHRDALTHATMDIINEMLIDAGSFHQFNSYEKFKKNFNLNEENNTITVDEENVYKLTMPLNALFTEDWYNLIVNNEINMLNNNTKNIIEALIEPNYMDDEADIKGVVNVNDFLNRQVFANKKRASLLKEKQNNVIKNKTEKFNATYNNYLNQILDYLKEYYDSYEEAVNLCHEQTLKRTR